VKTSMAYFPDLSTYAYVPSSAQAITTQNVGWLALGHDFTIATPSESLLERLWEFCAVSVWPTRGMHFCPFCEEERPYRGERGGVQLALGSAEIRVFGRTGQLAFASPNLIYHYVASHNYSPPPAFLEAVEAGPRPVSPEYREMLARAELPWTVTPLEAKEPAVFRFVKRDGKVEREWIVKPKR